MLNLPNNILKDNKIYYYLKILRWEIGWCVYKMLTKFDSLPLSLETIKNEDKLGKWNCLFESWTLALTLTVSSNGLVFST